MKHVFLFHIILVSLIKVTVCTLTKLALLKLNSVFTPIIYWQTIRVRYTLNPYIKQSFKEINQFANEIKNSDKCPGIIKTVIDKIQWAVDYMGKMYAPQQNANGGAQSQGQGGSMCNIF